MNTCVSDGIRSTKAGDTHYSEINANHMILPSDSGDPSTASWELVNISVSVNMVFGDAWRSTWYFYHASYNMLALITPF